MGAHDSHRGSLAVRIRKIESGQGETAEVLSVFCPLQNTSVSLDACAQCDQCESLYLDASERDSFLVCGRALESSGPPPWKLDVEAEATTMSTVQDVMSRQVVCVQPDLRVETLLQLFIEKGISGAPVVDASGHPIGVVSKTDILNERFLRSDTVEAEYSPATTVVTEQGYQLDLERGFHREILADTTVGDIMSPLVFSLPEGASVAQAAALMAYEGIHRAPVVSADDEVVGIVSSLDVLRWLGRKHGFVVPDRSSHRA